MAEQRPDKPKVRGSNPRFPTKPVYAVLDKESIETISNLIKDFLEVYQSRRSSIENDWPCDPLEGYKGQSGALWRLDDKHRRYTKLAKQIGME